MTELDEKTTDLPIGLVVSDDGKLLNWRGTNYVMQETIPEDMTDRQLLTELVTLARQVNADMGAFTEKLGSNPLLSKLFGGGKGK